MNNMIKWPAIIRHQQPGQTIGALCDGDVISDLLISRPHRFSRVGSVINGQLTEKSDELGGWLFDLRDLGVGLVPRKTIPAEAKQMTLGKGCKLEVTRDNMDGKGLRLRLLESDDKRAISNMTCPAQQLAHRHSRTGQASTSKPLKIFESSELDGQWAQELESLLLQCESLRVIDDTVTITIEPTRAFIAIDVDGQGQNLDINMQAAQMIATEVRLRNLQGLLVVDWAGLEQRKDRVAVIEALRNHFSEDPMIGDIGAMDGNCVSTFSRRRYGRACHEILFQQHQFPATGLRPRNENLLISEARAMAERLDQFGSKHEPAKLVADASASDELISEISQYFETRHGVEVIWDTQKGAPVS